MTTIVNDFEENEAERHEAKAHNEKEIEDLEDTQAKYVQEKKDLEVASEDILNKSDKICEKIDEQIKQWENLDKEQAKLYTDQLEQRKTIMEKIALEEETIDTMAEEVVHLERELNDYNENKNRLERNQQELQQQLDDINTNDKENASRQNYLQMSLKTLREEIARIHKELQENQNLLDEEVKVRQNLIEEVENLRRIIVEKEEMIKGIERQLELNKEEERKLQLDRKNLEKAIKQMDTAIDKLIKMLDNKKNELSQLQSQIDAFKETMEQLKGEMMQLQEQIQMHNEKLLQITQDLNNGEAQLKELDNERKVLEEKQRDFEKTSQEYDDASVDKNNQLKRLQQKLIVAEEIFNRSRTLVQELMDKKDEQIAQVKELKSEEERLTTELRTLATETQSLLDRKNDAVENQRSAEASNQEAQRNLAQLKQQEREHKSQHEKAKNDQARVRIQLQEAELEQNSAENEVIAAQAELDSAKSMSIVWSLVGMIPFVSSLASDKKQELSKAEATLQRAKDKVETKKSKISDLKDKLKGAEYRTGECARQYKTTQNAVEKQHTIAKTAASKLNDCKSSAQRLTEQYREATRREKLSESNLRMTTTKVQRAEAQLSTTNTELERRQELLNTHATQTENIRTSIEDMDQQITRHNRTIEEHRKELQLNLKAYTDKIQAHQTQSTIVEKVKDRGAILGSENSIVFKIYTTSFFFYFEDGSKELKNIIGNMNNTVKAKEREMVHQQAFYDAKKMNADELDQDIKNRQSILTNIRSDLESKMKELSDKQKQIKEKTDQKKKLEEEVENAKKEKVSNDAALREARSRVLVQENKVKNLDQQLHLLNVRDKELCVNIRIVEDKLQEKKSEIANTTKIINDISKHIENNRARHTNKQNVIETSNAFLKCLDDQLEGLNARIRERELEYKTLTEHLTQLNTSLNGNEQVKVKCYDKLKQLDTNITSFKDKHHQQQMNYYEESKKILEQHPDVIRNRNQNVQKNTNTQNRVTTG
ncbi:unnamed protein product [Adineta steineri]|uniref:Uncharacterized protein n=1 Tax=Adineta steineri TaxID=433720 RepID=A0A818KL98_9BILA|nr:unnamed protein product [Adineta steineri]CAF3557063.1 unnamed protein product [Adineta steineri]